MKTLEELVHKAEFAISLRKYEQARDLALEALTLDPENERANCTLARYELDSGKGDLKRAEEAARRACSSSNCDAFYLLALALRRQSRWDEAEAAIRSAIEISDHIPNYLLTLAAILHLRNPSGDQEQIAELVEEALRLDPTKKEAQLMDAFLLEARGKEKAAETQLREILDHHPDYAPALNNLGCLLHCQGRFREAEEFFWAALRDLPADYQDLIVENWQATVRTRFCLADWLQRWCVWFWRALRFRNPLSLFSQEKWPIRDALHSVLALFLLFGLLATLAVSQWDLQFYIDIVSGIVFCLFLSLPLGNLFPLLDADYRSMMGRRERLKEAFLAAAWLFFAAVFIVNPPEDGPLSAFLLVILFVLFTYSNSRRGGGSKIPGYQAKLSKLQMKYLFWPAVIMLGLACLWPLDIFIIIGGIAAVLIGQLALASLFLMPLEFFFFLASPTCETVLDA